MNPTLSEAQIQAVRRALGTGRDPAKIAGKLGVSRAAIEALGRGRPWRHLVSAGELPLVERTPRPRSRS